MAAPRRPPRSDVAGVLGLQVRLVGGVGYKAQGVPTSIVEMHVKAHREFAFGHLPFHRVGMPAACRGNLYAANEVDDLDQPRDSLVHLQFLVHFSCLPVVSGEHAGHAAGGIPPSVPSASNAPCVFHEFTAPPATAKR